jgi:thiol-disulfide isomerase/thioredoxin
MKKILFAALLFISFQSFAQEYDTVPAFKKTQIIPDFQVQLIDSSLFANTDIPKGKPVIITYFNPECGHCQLEAKEVSDNLDKFKNAFLLFVSYQPMDQIKSFAQQFKLDFQPNIRFGRDAKYFLPAFYRVEFTPYNAIYDKNGKFVRVYPTGMNVKEVTEWLKQ